MPLSPILKPISDKLYTSDPARYARLVIWIKRQQRHGWEDKVIAKTLEEWEQWDATIHFPDWWQPLTGLLKKIYPRVKQGESTEHKARDSMQEWKSLLTSFTEWRKSQSNVS